MEELINRHGKCPKCDFDWDAGDIFEALSRLAAYKLKSERELTNAALLFGWTKINQLHFSKIIVHEISKELIFYQCPNIMCGTVFNRETGQSYKSIYEAINSKISILDKMNVLSKVYDTAVLKIDQLIQKEKLKL